MPAPAAPSALDERAASFDIGWIIQMMLTVGVPAVLTLATVKEPVWKGQSSPHGYTVSLLLFLLPVARLFWWRFRHPKMPVHRRALFWASLAIGLIGFALDFFFGHAFFSFPNVEATLRIRLPAWDWSTGHWIPDYLPIEEFVFYVAGALFVLAVYVWADAIWLHAYHPREEEDLPGSRRALFVIHRQSVLIFLAALAAGMVIRKVQTDVWTLPGYYLFILLVGFAPTVLLLNGVQRFINWRAFAFAYVHLVLISLIWEATLAVPYNWWNYKPDHMLGLFIHGWSDLPAEAVLLWLVVAWDCVIAFEFCRIWLHMDDANDAQGEVALEAAEDSAARRRDVRS